MARLYSDLQRSEAFLAEGQSISSAGSWGWKVRSGKISWSLETFRIFEYDLMATPSLELVLRRVHPDDRALLQQVLDKASNQGTSFETECRLLMPDDRVKHLRVLAHALQDSSSNIEFVGAVMDVTERKRLGQRLRQAEKMEAVGRLAGGIAHDFNNVLAGILAYGEMLLDEAPADSPRKRYAQNVLTAATRGRALVEQILAYSRSQRGQRAPAEVAHVGILRPVAHGRGERAGDRLWSPVGLRRRPRFGVQKSRRRPPWARRVFSRNIRGTRASGGASPRRSRPPCRAKINGEFWSWT